MNSQTSNQGGKWRDLLASGREITAVICHYNPTNHPYLQHLVMLCVATLQRIPDDNLTILVCDGSPEADPVLAETFTGERLCYLHNGRQLNFGATYNMGIDAAETPYVALIANDILITSLQLQKLALALDDKIGCTIPYLTRSDYPTQIQRCSRVPRRSFPASMTLNVNLFRRDVLRAAGGVPEDLSGSFNDVVLFQRLREKGCRIALLNVGEVDHLRAVTRRTASNMNYERDLMTAPSLAPALFKGVQPEKPKNVWARIYANGSQYPLPRLLWRLVALVPWRLNQRRGLPYLVAWLEPYLSCELNRYSRTLVRWRPFQRKQA